MQTDIVWLAKTQSEQSKLFFKNPLRAQSQKHPQSCTLLVRLREQQTNKQKRLLHSSIIHFILLHLFLFLHFGHTPTLASVCTPKFAPLNQDKPLWFSDTRHMKLGTEGALHHPTTRPAPACPERGHAEYPKTPSFLDRREVIIGGRFATLKRTMLYGVIRSLGVVWVWSIIQ